MGLLRRGAASTTVSANPDLVWPVPKHWTLEDAVTVPSAFAHAYYILVSILSLLVYLFPVKTYIYLIIGNIASLKCGSS